VAYIQDETGTTGGGNSEKKKSCHPIEELLHLQTIWDNYRGAKRIPKKKEKNDSFRGLTY
jgi:hypothetical protein